MRIRSCEPPTFSTARAVTLTVATLAAACGDGSTPPVAVEPFLESAGGNLGAGCTDVPLIAARTLEVVRQDQLRLYPAKLWTVVAVATSTRFAQHTHSTQYRSGRADRPVLVSPPNDRGALP